MATLVALNQPVTFQSGSKLEKAHNYAGTLSLSNSQSQSHTLREVPKHFLIVHRSITTQNKHINQSREEQGKLMLIVPKNLNCSAR